MTSTSDIGLSSKALARARFVAVLSGAGISKESGLPTFREAQTGLWSRYDPEQLATPDAFKQNPDLVWGWYMYRRDLVQAAKPSAGHNALAQLEQLLDHVVIVTQNVDGLHTMAGSREVVELHGSLSRFKCSAACQGEPTLIDLTRVPYDKVHAPKCPACRAPIRPDVIWFGEPLPSVVLERATRAAAGCDVMLVVGTSGVVQPAASLPGRAREAGGLIIEINPEPSHITPSADIFLQGTSGSLLPRIVSHLWQMRSDSSADPRRAQGA
jgi:NAD-dependent deacetylase